MFGLDLHESVTAIVAVLAALLTAYTVWKQWLEGPKISVEIGDAVDLVRSDDGTVRKLHLACSFYNSANKPGAVSKIVIVLLDNSSQRLFNWLQFYEYRGGHVASPSSKPCPVAVLGRSTVFQGIEFITDAPMKIREGVYRFVVLAWSGRSIASSTPFFKEEYEFNLEVSHLSELNPSNRPGEFFLVPVPLLGMQLSFTEVKKYVD